MTNITKAVVIAFFVAGAFITPNVIHAQTADEQRLALIEQLIALLEEKVASLVAQLEALQDEDGITSNSNQVFGSVDSMQEYAIQVAVEQQNTGTVKFTIQGDYKTATLTYYPTNDPSNKIENGNIFADVAGDRKGLAGYFHPETEYYWSVNSKNESGQSAHAEGTFTTGKY